MEKAQKEYKKKYSRLLKSLTNKEIILQSNFFFFTSLSLALFYSVHIFLIVCLFIYLSSYFDRTLTTICWFDDILFFLLFSLFRIQFFFSFFSSWRWFGTLVWLSCHIIKSYLKHLVVAFCYFNSLTHNNCIQLNNWFCPP